GPQLDDVVGADGHVDREELAVADGEVRLGDQVELLVQIGDPLGAFDLDLAARLTKYDLHPIPPITPTATVRIIPITTIQTTICWKRLLLRMATSTATVLPR